MSWSWTPLCQIGSDRYRITGLRPDRSTASSIVVRAAQCDVVQAQLPSDTTLSVVSSVVIPTSQTVAVTTFNHVGPQVSTSINSLPSHVSSSIANPPISLEERAVRRSPRLARNNQSICRSENESQQISGRNDWNVPRWNTNSQEVNNTQQVAKNNIYNFEGHVNAPSITNNAVSVVYTHTKNINMTHSRLHPAPISIAKLSGNTVPTILTPKPSPKKKVIIKNLAFYNVVNTLLEEEILHEVIGPLQRVFRFSLTSETLKQLRSRKRKLPYQVQLRLCKLDSSAEQSDYYPVTHQILLNNQQVLLPGLETVPRGYMRPMDITLYCQPSHLAQNFLMIRCWESCKVFVRVVEKYTSQDLLESLEKRSFIREEDTSKEIKIKLEVDQNEEEIASATLQFSLNCPLSRTRMKLPCRASTCNHLQCFDAATYIQLNECKAKWSCPVCYKPALFENLKIDSYFKKILDEQHSIDKIELHPDGSWTSVEVSKKKSHPDHESGAAVPKDADESRDISEAADKTMVILDSDDDDCVAENGKGEKGEKENNQDDAVTISPAVRRSDSSDIETIVLSDDESLIEETPIVMQCLLQAHLSLRLH
ncbi:hypothetical protein SK128_001001 [Halocaridina rubra]|uniref:Uncharacterized protein n=1 Tax=Halocaridina rubra TaxID=373956 RepID=A0AAN9AGF4_HALRR